MFDPCGTRKLEGEDILKRLAEYLGVDEIALEQTLIELANKRHIQNQLYLEK